MLGPSHPYGMPNDMPWPDEMILEEDSGLHLGNVAHNSILNPPLVRKRKVRVQR